MSSYNRLLPTSNNTPERQNKTMLSKLLRQISNFGMDAEQMVIKNTVTTSINEEPGDGSQGGGLMYDAFSKKTIAKLLDKKSIAYLDRAFSDKNNILRQYSVKLEIKDFVSDMADECIIYDTSNFFCTAKDLPSEFDNTVKQRYQENFIKLYNNFGFADNLTAWNYMKNFLVYGYLVFEIVYDNKQKNIIDISPIDPASLVPASDPETGTIIWIQYPDSPVARKILLDAQIIYISYSNNRDYAETSYVENLIRPYNELKLIEQTKILYNINQSAIYKKFIVPTNGLSPTQGKNVVRELMSEYYEHVQFDDSLGTVTINGSADLPLSKDFWFPSGDAGTPTVEIVGASGNDLNEDIMLKHFRNNLRIASKFPASRSNTEDGGGTIHNDASEITNNEIKFGLYKKRIQTVFKELIVKPLKIQMICDFPELRMDQNFLTSINIEFNQNEYFEKWKRLGNLAKEAEIVSTLNANLPAEDDAFIPNEYALKHIMSFTNDQYDELMRYRLEREKKKGQITGGTTPEGGGSSDAGMSGGDMDADTGVQSQPSAQTQAETPPPAQETPPTETV